MKIQDRLTKLAYERKMLISKVVDVAEDIKAIPQTKHVKIAYKLVKISDLSQDEQNAIIRFSHKPR